ncbi:MAG: hypothetical protein HHJ16_07560 [Polaromonas sp.]|uniref:hypothetical protein n=1 Tax=Polaromonas sp. TaxID=1869339 RepID=UPI0017E9ED98|nr:hypothetical protein [Polaromonas sp.]NMM10112.1 hypothetical protein [Polaromonas sp.]
MGYAIQGQGRVALMRKSKAILLVERKAAPEVLAEMTWNDARRQAPGDAADWTPEEEEK